MADEAFKRKLTAILSADAVGYSRLMRDDEDRTIRTLTTYRSAITALVEKFRGHVVDATGDNLLAEFTSVVDAVNCGVEIQRELAERNSELPDERKMQFRIGINLGDVVKEDDRIYGDGVNIAARMESLAEPKEICISGSVHDSVESRLGLGFEYLGEQKVKNIDKPVRAYRVASYPGAAAHRVVQAKESLGKRWRKISIAVAAAVVIIGGLAFWQFYLRKPDVEPASMEKMSYALPDKPSIAILAFDNMSGNASLEYFSDGITEQIISALSKVPNLFVIARNSSFTYKGKPVKVQQVSEDLGVQYVLEGSVRKAGDRLRVTAQLIDAITGHHMWSETYDRELEDIFAIQDEITMKILTELQGQLTEGERVFVRDQHISNLQAYLKILEAKHYLNMYKHAEAIKLLEEALELDPKSATIYGFLSFANLMNTYFGPASIRAESLEKAFEFAEKCTSLDDKLSGCHQMLGHCYLKKREYDRALAEGKEAISLDPNSALAALWYGWTLRSVGRYEDALSEYERAIRLDPLNTNMPRYHKCATYNVMRRHEDAIATCERVLEDNPKNLSAHYQLAVAYSFMDRMDEARESASEILKRNPNFTLENWAKSLPYKNQADIDLLVDGLRKAGIPDRTALPLPDKPSIAVLPFDNLSDDPEQEYFSDGITDDLITDLSKISGLFVVARNSTFTFKGQHKKVQQIGKELGVRYVLEGSVRKYSDKIRINAQLIDSQTGGHLWAERYDRDFKEIFELQDEVINKIVSVLSVKLTGTEKDIVGKQKTVNLQAYEYYLRGKTILHDLTGKNLSKSKRMFELAIKSDQGFAHAYAAHAMANLFIYRLKVIDAGITPREARSEAYEYVNKTIELNPNLSTAYSVLGSLELIKSNFDKAVNYSRKAVNLDPNDPDGYVVLGYILSKSGDHKAGLEIIKKAFRLDPIPPHYYYYYLGHVLVNNKQYKEALESIKKAGPETPEPWRHELLVSYAYLNEMDKAKSELEKILTIRPRSNISWAMITLAFKQNEDKKHWAEAYRKVGLPEYPYSYEGDENNILSKKEILDLIVDKTLTGIDPEKGQLWMHYSKDGTFRDTGSVENYGRYWLEGNKLCRSYKKYPGYVDFIFIYRNPDGSFEEKNEYHMFFTFLGTLPVSVEK